jgi:pimeloyl-ACP methyl ester carboxylesterase
MIERQQLAVNGMEYFVLASGTGPLVLLCHGFPETSYAWRHQLPALASEGFYAVAPDLRGVGNTQGPKAVDQYTLMHLVGDMVGLVHALGKETAMIIGNDWGASLAWQAALIRPDVFTAVAAIGVPMMGQSPVPPTRIFPNTPEALFYTLYFQEPGQAEAELSEDIEVSLRKILFNASADARSQTHGAQRPNPFSMVSRKQGLLAPLHNPSELPQWLTQHDLQRYVDAFKHSGFSGALNLYRNLDRNWELQKAFAGQTVRVPALFCIGEHDVGWDMPGMKEIIAQQKLLVPELRRIEVIPNGGHWLPQEQPDALNAQLLEFITQASTANLKH